MKIAPDPSRISIPISGNAASRVNDVHLKLVEAGYHPTVSFQYSGKRCVAVIAQAFTEDSEGELNDAGLSRPAYHHGGFGSFARSIEKSLRRLAKELDVKV